MHEQRLAALGQDRQRRAQLGLARRGEIVDAGVAEEGLDAAGAGVEQRAERRLALPGTSPPQKAQSTRPSPAAASRLRSSASRVVVTGLLLSGMSTSVVTPPAAAARVAVSKPSHSVRPGSLTWTWLSTSPGISTDSPTSSVGVPAGTVSAFTTAAIRPSRTNTAPARSPSGVTTRRLINARSAGAAIGSRIGEVAGLYPALPK